MWKRKKERPLTAFLFHALSLGGPRFPRPGLGSAPAEVCGACCLAHADRRALRTARCTLWAVTPAAQTPLRLKVLPTDSTSGCPPRCGPPPAARSAQTATKVHRQSTSSVLSCPARTPLPAKAPSGTHSGCGPARGYQPPPQHGTHTKPHALTLPPAAPSPRRRCPSPVPEKGCISVPRPGPGPRRRVLGSRAPREAIEP